MDIVSGKVIWNIRKGKDRNQLFIASRKYGWILAVLADKEAEGIVRNDYVQLTGKLRRRTHKYKDGHVSKETIITTPVVEHILHTKKIKEY